ncbi:hypothetical protein, partial [Phaeobacter sp.]|uniref:hypothetical protein n=1 Tax=Phaeobacter sp. TaxID=1902409 RepID=UPI0025CD8B0B
PKKKTSPRVAKKGDSKSPPFPVLTLQNRPSRYQKIHRWLRKNPQTLERLDKLKGGKRAKRDPNALMQAPYEEHPYEGPHQGVQTVRGFGRSRHLDRPQIKQP